MTCFHNLVELTTKVNFQVLHTVRKLKKIIAVETQRRVACPTTDMLPKDIWGNPLISACLSASEWACPGWGEMTKWAGNLPHSVLLYGL